MALDAATIWEIRANGDATNGGGFVPGGAGTDYSQQDTAELALTDLTTAGAAATTITSATGGFTAAMEDNLIYIASGTNFDVGFYQIVTYTDANNVILDRSPTSGGAGSGGNGKVGGAQIFADEVFEAWADGNTAYVANDGTHTLVADVAISNFGSQGAAMTVIGYNSTRGDEPTSTDRPLVAAAANQLEFGSFYRVRNLRATTTHTSGMDFGDTCVLSNCNVQNTSGSANRDCVEVGSSGRIIGCELHGSVGTNLARGADLRATDGRVIYSFFHDLNIGCQAGGDNHVVANSVFRETNTGLVLNAGGDECDTFGNTFYDGNAACNVGTEADNLFVGNIVHTQLSFGLSGGVGYHILDYNVWHNNGTDVINSEKGPNAITADPLLTDPANDDYTLGFGSPAANIFLNTTVGLPVDLKVNAGAAQNDVDGGGVIGGPNKRAGMQ